MIAVSERYSMKEQAIVLIRRFSSLTPGRFLTLYTVIRQLTGIFGIRISGMVHFVRPIVHPMATAAARSKGVPQKPAVIARATASSRPRRPLAAVLFVCHIVLMYYLVF